MKNLKFTCLQHHHKFTPKFLQKSLILRKQAFNLIKKVKSLFTSKSLMTCSNTNEKVMQITGFLIPLCDEFLRC